MTDINTSLLQWLNGPGPQYQNAQGKMEAAKGQNGAAYNVIYGADGQTPISVTNRLPISANMQVGGADVSGTNAVPTQLTGSNIKVVTKTIDDTTAVSGSNGYTLTNIFSSVGTVGKLVHIGHYAPAISGATTGVQKFVAGIGAVGYAGQQSYSIPGGSNGGAVSQSALDGSVGVKFSDSIPLVVQYINGTDVQQTGTRKTFITYLEIGAI